MRISDWSSDVCSSDLRGAGHFHGERAGRLLRRVLHRDRLGMTGEDIGISVKGLNNAFGEQVIHEELDLEVRRGEILGVVGGSGTGKSVLMRSIIGLQQPVSGEIEVLGQPMLDGEPEDLRQIRRRWGVLFQAGAPFSTLKVAENVQVPPREYYRLDEALLDDIDAYTISMAGLTPDAGPKYPSELTGGMRKGRSQI